ncbi:MAG: MFS transporter [Syntrophales bacterium]|nr:MFS transporter [Syntrophales bacterium]
MFYGWWIVIACFFISLMVSGTVFYGFTAFFEPIVKDFQWSYTQVSLASSIRGMEMGLLAPLVGYLADRWGAKRILFAGMTILGLGLILLGQINSLTTFYLVMLLIAFGAGGCTSVVTMTIVARWFKRHLGKALAVMSSGFGASGLLIPFIVFLVDLRGWREALVILGLVMWTVGIPLVLMLREHPDSYACGADNIKQDHGLNRPRVPYLSYLKYPPFLLINLAETLRFLVLTSVVVHIMPFLSQIGIPRNRAGFMAASIPLVSIGGRFLFGWLADRYDTAKVTACAFLVMAAGMASLTFVCYPLFAFGFLIFFPLGFGGLTVLRGTIVAHLYDKRDFGSLMGILMGFSALGGIVGPTVTGWFFDRLGNYSYVWIGFSGLLVFAIFLILKGIRSSRLHLTV